MTCSIGTTYTPSEPDQDRHLKWTSSSADLSSLSSYTTQGPVKFHSTRDMSKLARNARKKQDNNFIAWSSPNLDLHTLLGEYTGTEPEDGDDWLTDSEAESEKEEQLPIKILPDEESSDSDKENEHGTSPKRSRTAVKRPQLKPTATTYMCPTCDKVLKSIAGFRGHMQRIHKLTNVKDCIIKEGIHNVLTKIALDPIHMLESSKKGRYIINIAKSLQSLGPSCLSMLNSHLSQVVLVLGTGATLQLDRELMYKLYNRVRLNGELLSVLLSDVQNQLPCELHPYISIFLQVFLDELLDYLICKQTSNIRGKGSRN